MKFKRSLAIFLTILAVVTSIGYTTNGGVEGGDPGLPIRESVEVNE